MSLHYTVAVLTILAIAPAHSVAGAYARQPVDCPGNLCPIRPQDQVWRISTRHLGNCGDPCTRCCPQLQYSRWDACQGWVCASEEEFLATDDPGSLTAVYVHGNRMDAKSVDDHGFKIYCLLTCQNCSDQPLRYVIWSWPSQQLPCRTRVIKDVRVKATRTDMQSHYLGWWLSRLQPDRQVSLLGYSYGARTILGALHMLAGAPLAGRCLPPSPYDATVQPRVVLWATAAQASWIVPGQRYGLATCPVSRGLVMYNPCDPVLKRYQRMLPEATGPALGLGGVVCQPCIPCVNKLSQMNVSCIVGARHAWDKYYESPRVASCTRRYALWLPVD